MQTTRKPMVLLILDGWGFREDPDFNAIESADTALMSDDLRKLPWLVGHSRRTLRIVRQNIVFALGVKVAVFALASFGMATLWMAIAADMGASLLVIANGLRLLRSA